MCDLYDWPALANSRGNEGQSPFHREVQDSERCSSCRSTRVFASAPKKVSGGKRVNHEAEVKCAGFAGAEVARAAVAHGLVELGAARSLEDVYLELTAKTGGAA